MVTNLCMFVLIHVFIVISYMLLLLFIIFIGILYVLECVPYRICARLQPPPMQQAMLMIIIIYISMLLLLYCPTHYTISFCYYRQYDICNAP